MEKFEINRRIMQLIEYLGISNNKFASEIGISSSRISAIATNRNRPDSDLLAFIINKYSFVSGQWLVAGVGSMIINDTKGIKEYKPLEIKKRVSDPIVNEYKLKTDSIKEIQEVPLYDLEAVAGLVPLFNDTIKHVPIDFIKIPNLPRCDGAIYITGDSMYPLLKSGDIILYKQVVDVNNGIFWGEMYLLSIDMSGEDYVTVKYIQKSDIPDHVRLVSYNQHHSDKDVAIASIRALAFIKASIRINSMK